MKGICLKYAGLVVLWCCGHGSFWKGSAPKKVWTGFWFQCKPPVGLLALRCSALLEAKLCLINQFMMFILFFRCLFLQKCHTHHLPITYWATRQRSHAGIEAWQFKDNRRGAGERSHGCICLQRLVDRTWGPSGLPFWWLFIMGMGQNPGKSSKRGEVP